MRGTSGMGWVAVLGALSLAIALTAGGEALAAEAPETGAVADVPDLPGVPPMVRRSVDELPTGPETPADQLPAAYPAALGDVYLHYHQWDKAEAAFREAYQKEKDESRRGPYAYHLGQLLLRKGELDRALPLMEEAVRSAQADARLTRRYLLTLALLFEKAGQPAKAETTYEEAVRKSAPGYEADLTRRALAAFWRRTGQLDAAIAKNEAALRQKPNDQGALETLQLIYTSVKPDPEKALALAERLVAAEPKNYDAAVRLAALYERTRKFDKAADVIRDLMERDPTEAGALARRLTQLLTEGGKKDEALRIARDVLAKAPASSEAHLQAAGIYQDAGKADEAIAEFEAAARLAKDEKQRENCLLSAAQTARLNRRYAKAEEITRQLLKSQFKPVATLAKRLLFDIYSEQNKLDQLPPEEK